MTHAHEPLYFFCRRTPLPPGHETTATSQPNKRNNDPGARVVLFCRGAPRAPGQHWQERCRAYLGKPPVQEQRKLNRMIHAHGPLYFFSRWAPRPPGRRMTTMPPSLQRKNGQHGRKAHNEKRINQARNRKELTALCRQFFVIVATCSCYAVVAASCPGHQKRIKHARNKKQLTVLCRHFFS